MSDVGTNGDSLHWHVLPCPFCGAEAVEFEVLAEEVYDKQAWRIKHNKDCWFSNGRWQGEHVITKSNMYHWNFRQNSLLDRLHPSNTGA
jgi:hypothetical protein